MDLFNAPFNYVHELYYYTFCIKEEREKERKAEEEKAKQEEENKKRIKSERDSVNKIFNKRLSPAEQARQANIKKSQDDDNKKSEEINNNTTELSPPNMNIEDLVDLLEEGG